MKIFTLEGMLTHLILDMDGGSRYIFQPKGLNPKTLQPVERISLDKSRIIGATEEEVDLPVNILGKPGEDIATGFKGTIIGLIYHINGCLHVDIKPKGTLPDSGDTVAAHEFDIRRMIIDGKKPLSKFELKKSIKETPSPESKPLNKYKS